MFAYEFAKNVLLSGLLWYVCHKYIRKLLHPKKRNNWSTDDELDARLGGLASSTRVILNAVIKQYL
jgi:hypothetical protein